VPSLSIFPLATAHSADSALVVEYARVVSANIVLYCYMWSIFQGVRFRNVSNSWNGLQGGSRSLVL